MTERVHFWAGTVFLYALGMVIYRTHPSADTAWIGGMCAGLGASRCWRRVVQKWREGAALDAAERERRAAQ